VGCNVAEAGAVVRAATAPDHTAAGARGKRKRAVPTTRTGQWADESDGLVEVRRRRRRNKAGQYVLEYLLRSPTPRPGLASPARDGCPSQSTPTCSTSWKTFRVRKACDEWRSAEPAEQQSQSVDSTVVRKTKRVTVRCVRGPRAAAEPAIAARGKISREDRAREGEAAPNRRWVHAADCDFECSV